MLPEESLGNVTAPTLEILFEFFRARRFLPHLVQIELAIDIDSRQEKGLLSCLHQNRKANELLLERQLMPLFVDLVKKQEASLAWLALSCHLAEPSHTYIGCWSGSLWQETKIQAHLVFPREGSEPDLLH